MMDNFLVEGANKWMYEDDGAENWVNEEPTIGDDEITIEDDEPIIEDDLFSLAEDLVSGYTYEQFINTIEANEQSHDEDTVDKVFEEELKRITENAKENYEVNKEKIMTGLNGNDETNEGIMSGSKSEEERLAKSMLRIIKDKGADVRTVVSFMLSKIK